jgi:hypothetical protein
MKGKICRVGNGGVDDELRMIVGDWTIGTSYFDQYSMLEDSTTRCSLSLPQKMRTSQGRFHSIVPCYQMGTHQTKSCLAN